MAIPRNATIIALHGDRKPAEWTAVVAAVQAGLTAAVGDRFAARPVPGVHLTIVGLERGRVDVVGLCRYLDRELAQEPLTVRFGGVAADDPRVDGRGRRLYERALVVGAEKVVLVGWPIGADGEPTDRLDRLRRAAGRFGAHHRYYTSPESRDPDAYSVIGDLLPGVDRERLDRGAARCRAALARSRCRIRLAAQDVRLASYVDSRLPVASTTTVALTDVVAGVDGVDGVVTVP